MEERVQDKDVSAQRLYFLAFVKVDRYIFPALASPHLLALGGVHLPRFEE